jgi:hypothetical protein
MLRHSEGIAVGETVAAVAVGKREPLSIFHEAYRQPACQISPDGLPCLLNVGNKSDRIDARKLAELLYLGKLTPVYHGEHGVRTLKELSRSYLTISGVTEQCASQHTYDDCSLEHSYSYFCCAAQVCNPFHSNRETSAIGP